MLSNKCNAISPSITLAISAKAKAMKAMGKNVIGFAAGEPDFGTPEFIINAAKKALDEGFTRYTPASGLPKLKEVICKKLKEENNITYQPNEILVSNGAKHSLTNAFMAILNPGEEVIIPSPYWVSYPEMVKLADGVPVFVETSEENGFKISPAQLKESINEKTKAIIINSPSNPTGSVYTKSELEEIAKIAVEKKIFVVSDEIYEYIIYNNQEHISIASLNDDIKALTITINGVSKAYAMTGWRIGYTAASKEIIALMSAIQSHMTSNPNSIAQIASIAAIESKLGDDVQTMVSAFDHRRKLIKDEILKISEFSVIEPNGAFYLFVNVKNVFGKSINGKVVKDSFSFAESLLDEKEVAVIPGIGFGADNYIRMSYAVSDDDIIEGVQRIKEFVESLED